MKSRKLEHVANLEAEHSSGRDRQRHGHLRQQTLWHVGNDNPNEKNQRLHLDNPLLQRENNNTYPAVAVEFRQNKKDQAESEGDDCHDINQAANFFFHLRGRALCRRGCSRDRTEECPIPFKTVRKSPHRPITPVENTTQIPVPAVKEQPERAIFFAS